MGIPPHAARLAGTWSLRSAAAAAEAAFDGASTTPDLQAGPVEAPSVPQPAAVAARQVRRDRSHRITASRILHPLHRHA